MTNSVDDLRVRILKWTFLGLMALSLTLTGLAFGTAAFVLSMVASGSTMLAMTCFEVQSRTD